MKKTLLTFAVLIITVCISATNTFAQADAGGYAGASIIVETQPFATKFTRHNGEDLLSQAQIRLYYNTTPTVPPVLNQIYYNGTPLFLNFAPVTGDISQTQKTGYVTFNIPTSNIPPAIKLTLFYQPSASQGEVTITGND